MNIADEIMPTLSGDPVEPIKRFVTGFYSFDRALANDRGDIGMPLGAGYEVVGQGGVGKTTFIYSMLGFLGNKLNQDTALVSFEDFDSESFLRIQQAQGFEGDTKMITQGSDEQMMTNWLDTLRPVGKAPSKPRTIAALDSVAAISPVSEQDGDLGMGYNTGRAVLMAQASRRLLNVMAGRNVGSEVIVFYTNHWYKSTGGNWIAPGGNAKDYLCRVRILLKAVPTARYIDGYVLQGTIQKNNYGHRYYKTKEGLKPRVFYMFVRYGHGIHFGLTALWDAVLAGKATKGSVIKIKDKSYGYINDIVTNKFDDPEFFQPFVEALNEN